MDRRHGGVFEDGDGFGGDRDDPGGRVVVDREFGAKKLQHGVGEQGQTSAKGEQRCHREEDIP